MPTIRTLGSRLRSSLRKLAAPFGKKVPVPQIDKVAAYLNGLPDAHLTIIDVGCHAGSFLESLQRRIKADRTVFSVGIDPVRFDHPVPYSVFLQIAISDDAEGQRDFHVYEDPQCNSLRRMRVDRITHDISEKEQKWYVARNIEALRSVEKVPCRRLSSVIEELRLADKVIHYLKIDAQGDDLSAVKSLGKYLQNVLLVQIESVVSHDDAITLYEDQPLFEEDKDFLTRHGFAVFDLADYSATASPEADVVYLNKQLAARLARSTRRKKVQAEILPAVGPDL